MRSSSYIPSKYSASLNFTFTFKYDKINGYCKPNYDIENWWLRFHEGVLLLFGFFIPHCLMLVIYALIIREFYIKSKLGNNVESPVKIKYRKKVVVFLGIVICVFLVSWSPFGIVFILMTMTDHLGTPADPRFDVRNMRLLKLVTLPCFCAAILNVACYAVKDVEMRNGFKEFFGCSSNDKKGKGRSLSRTSRVATVCSSKLL